MFKIPSVQAKILEIKTCLLKMPLNKIDIECNKEREKYNKVRLHQNEEQFNN